MKLGGMDLQRCLVFLLYLSCIITLSATAQPPDLSFSICGQTGNYTQNSTYHNNLNTLVSSLSSKVDEYGFYNASEGQIPDRTSVVALCRGDVELGGCRNCVNNAAKKMMQSCPNQKAAFGGYNECMIRYSDEFIIGSIAKYPIRYWWKYQNATSIQQFDHDLRNLLDGLRNKAANGSSFLKFAVDKTTGPDFQPIYALVQCTPDLSAQECSACLNSSFEAISGCADCTGKRAAALIWPSCNFRYDSDIFYSHTLIHVPAPPPVLPPSSSPPPPQSGTKEDDDHHTTPTVLYVVVPLIVVVLVMLTIIVCIVLRKRRKRRQQNGGMEGKFELITLQSATENFSEANKIGEGGFGVVYKGKLENDQLVAVKRLSENSRQGNLEFKNEVELIANLQHKNLVRLLGYCQEGREMILVYEFVPNGSLEDILFHPVKRGYLIWERRYKIIENIARGLVYLHEDSHLRIIHRDLKASNILLDADLNPKIADFGMARLFALNQAHGSTNTLIGAYGYMAPEYARYGKFSEKSDVYSFGVLVLEIISGQRNTIQTKESTRDLLFDVWTHWKEGSISNVIDSILQGSSTPMREIRRCIHVALLCVQERLVDRPKMSQVLQMLSRNSSRKPPEPSDPGFYTQSSVNS